MAEATGARGPAGRPLGASHTPAYPTADLTNCDREPIHIPGAIQPHGCLLACSSDLGEIVTASANCDDLLGVPAAHALGLPLHALLGTAATDEVALRLATDTLREPLVLTLPAADDLESGRVGAGSLAGATVDVQVHRSGDRVVVEVEPVAQDVASGLTYYSARGSMNRLAEADSIIELVDILADEVRRLLGFDRVMVYRFDGEWNGEVIAERKTPELGSFFGHHYPATDIPAQARRLYTVNWTRLIADLAYEPVPLVPVLDPATGAPLDLSFSTLRSVSPVHVEYLTIMGVTASMSISLIVEGQLWGLIAAHHYSGPHRPGHDSRAAAEFLGQVASQMIATREAADHRDAALTARAQLTGITNRVTASDQDPLDALLDDPELLSLMDATGAVVAYDDYYRTVGEVPSEEAVRRIAAALSDTHAYATYTDKVPLLGPDLRDDPEVTALAAGALRIGGEPDQFIMWLRPEQVRVVDWGGDPNKKYLTQEEGPEVRLSPRRSFEKWREVTRGTSRPWEPWRVEAADGLGVHLTSTLLSRAREHVAVADAVQRSVVLAEVPTFPGLRLAARYRPAATLQMGGDWWDAFALADGRVAVVIGDVAGHGVDAASTMIQLRTALRAYLNAGFGPAAALDQLDALMMGLLPDQVATGLVATVDPATGEVEIASAGHPAPLLVGDGEATPVELLRRPLLGVGAPVARATRFVVPPGARLLLYTDGLVEKRGTDLAERTERLAELAGAGSVRPELADDLDAWADHVLSIQDVQDGAEDDDTTVLVVQRDPA